MGVQLTVLIGLGANLPSPEYGAARQTLETVLREFPYHGVRIVECSPWYESVAVPPSDQPNYVNGVAEVETDLSPTELLASLHTIEQQFGRVRKVRNEPRLIDLDLLAYDDVVILATGDALAVPHPRLHLRAFVLIPMRDIAPDWKHPVLGQSVDKMIETLPLPLGVSPLSA